MDMLTPMADEHLQQVVVEIGGDALNDVPESLSWMKVWSDAFSMSSNTSMDGQSMLEVNPASNRCSDVILATPRQR